MAGGASAIFVAWLLWLAGCGDRKEVDLSSRQLALEQEEAESCAQIVGLASRGVVTLVIPAFRLAEPHQAIAAKAKVRSRLGQELRTHVRDLMRSRTQRDYRDTFEQLLAVLINGIVGMLSCHSARWRHSANIA